MTLGIVYGDIGTSPLYVFKAIISGGRGVSDLLVLGGISCIFWTLTLQTTIKYVLITLRADNHGEGGIFSLFALLKKKSTTIVILTMIGGCTLLADGVITPAITVTSAIEGLQMVYQNIPVVPFVLAILVFLFLFQRFGTHAIGRLFGPIMFVFFLMLGVLGVSQIITMPHVLLALNPVYAVELLIEYPSGILLLGAVFSGYDWCRSTLFRPGALRYKEHSLHVDICQDHAGTNVSGSRSLGAKSSGSCAKY